MLLRVDERAHPDDLNIVTHGLRHFRWLEVEEAGLRAPAAAGFARRTLDPVEHCPLHRRRDLGRFELCEHAAGRRLLLRRAGRSA